MLAFYGGVTFGIGLFLCLTSVAPWWGAGFMIAGGLAVYAAIR